ncbi:MAG TPA: carboxypeptidase-like regulatory domain-containing protein [Pyrinomonadaceae bacterium]|nr:carboxypeptidase-like regulatory domain-containing protein [Pyrinomonadaceae bacterium]
MNIYMNAYNERRIAVWLFTAFICLICLAPGSAQISTGGAYGMEQSVTASGGGSSNATIYKLEGTPGQPASGVTSTGGRYGSRGGFWQPMPLTPSAAGMTLSGRVLTAEGRGLRGAIIRINGSGMTTPRIVMSGVNGTFSFADVEPGQTYVISVASRRFGFATPTQVITVTDNVADILFQAGWQN